MGQAKADSTDPIALIAVTDEVGVFGTSLLDKASPSVVRAPLWRLGSSGPSTEAFAALVRIVPRWDGAPSNTAVLTLIGPSGNGLGELEFVILSTGQMRLRFSDMGQNVFSATTTETYTDYVSGTAVDLMVSWDGTTDTGALKFSVDGVELGVVTPGHVGFVPDQTVRSSVVCGIGITSAIGNFDVNEIVVFDNSQAHTFSTRTGFWNVSQFDGSVYTDAGIANVKIGTDYTYAGAALTGTYDGSDRWSDPAATNVRNAIAYKANSISNNRTGSLDLPAQSDTKHGVHFDGATKSGTYRGEDLWQAVEAEHLEVGITRLQDGVYIAGTLVDGGIPDERSVLNAILRFIGSSSLTDDEFDALDMDGSTPAADVYAALLALLDSRAESDAMKARLKSYFLAKNVNLDDEPEPTAVSTTILIGDDLDDSAAIVGDGKSNLLLGGEL